jgi:hypothetical protein
MKHILNILFVLCTANSHAQSVGIGTTTPYAKLEISHSSASRPSIAIKDSSTSLAGWLQFGQVNSFRNMNLYGYASTDGSSASQRLYIGSDSIAAALTIKGDGNIGIGSAAPNSKLEIVHNSSSRPSLAVTDLSPIFAGWVQMSRQGSNRNMNIYGFPSTDGSSASQRMDFGSDSAYSIFTLKGNGNVGINKPAPTEKLDINGSINITNGTLKANGIEGLPGQYLGINNSNQLLWMDKSEYKNFIEFNTPVTNATWNIPIGTTKILVELWGAGGGGVASAGGGGGGYCTALLNVTGFTTLTYTLGAGGIAAYSPPYNTSQAGYSSHIFLGTTNVVATGGGGATFSTDPGGTISSYAGSGGTYYTTPTIINVTGKIGSSGQSKQVQVIQSSATTFCEISSGGNGGDAANAPNTGGVGAYLISRILDGVNIYRTSFSSAQHPGGGGGSGYKHYFSISAPFSSGGNGANGRVIIYY